MPPFKGYSLHVGMEKEIIVCCGCGATIAEGKLGVLLDLPNICPTCHAQLRRWEHRSLFARLWRSIFKKEKVISEAP